MKRILIILTIILILTGCTTQPKPYVSPYGSPFAPRLTQEQIEELTLYVTRELWAQVVLRAYENEHGDDMKKLSK